MPIVNRGLYNLETIFDRQVGNDWPTAQVITTSDVVETTNFYFSNARALAAIDGQNLNLNDVVIYGDLTVEGNTTTLNTATLIIEDKNIVLANGAVDSSAADGAGITIDGAQANITYQQSGDKFVINKNLDITGNLIFGAGSGGAITDLDSLETVSITSNVWNNLYTSNVLESDTNLYFTNTRVVSALVAGDNITIESNGRISSADAVEFANIANTIQSLSNFTTDNLNEGSANLYFTNTRVVSALVAGDNITIESNGRISASSVVETANTVATISNFTTDNLTEGSNLYYTNSRARTAFTAGKNVTITPDGVISSRDDTGIFNIDLDGSSEYRLSETMSSAINFNIIQSNSKVILKSFYLTNITDSTAYFSGNIKFSNGNSVIISNKIPLPEGTSLEFLDKPFVFSSGDVINLQGFDSAGNPTANLIDCIFTYETINGDISYQSTGYDLIDNTSRLLIESTDTHHIVESIRIVNADDGISKANVYITDANDNIRAFITHNMSIPPNTAVEVLNAPKRINLNSRLYVSKNSPNISVACAYRIGQLSYISEQQTEVFGGGNLSVDVTTNIPDGTVIYYSIQQQ